MATRARCYAAFPLSFRDIKEKPGVLHFGFEFEVLVEPPIAYD